MSTAQGSKYTYRRDIEGSDGVLSQVLHLLQSHLDVAIGSGAIGRPVLVALDLHSHTHRITWDVFQIQHTIYLVLLFEVGHHDNGGRVKLPYHTPEVWEGGWDRTLRCNVAVGTLVGLQGNRARSHRSTLVT